jgi:glyoxylase-like metal-dependent hydrolase (beta-lactamase superfamily II)
MKKNIVPIIAIIAIVVIVYFAIQNQDQPSRVLTPETAAPIPDSSMGVMIDQNKGYMVEEINSGLYYVTEGTYQIMFMTTGAGVIVVDAPPSIGENILKAIAEVTDEPITHIIYSHSHADHIAAASMYPSDAIYIAHSDTLAQLQRADNNEIPFGIFVGGSPVPLPTVTFEKSYTLKVGNQTLELVYMGPSHELGNIYIYAPKQKVLMLVDVIFPGWSPFKDLAVAEDVPAFIKAHDYVLTFDFDTFIGGHLNRLGNRDDVQLQKEYISDIQANAASALQSVDFMDIASKVGFSNPWLLFSTYLDAVEEVCNDLTVSGWTERLAGVDVFTSSHCAKIIESLRID